jgi:ribonucleoside-diphosphate reductase alpha chain
MTKETNFDNEAFKWLNENKLSYDIWNNKYRYNNESFNDWLIRVSGDDAAIARLIREKKFLFGGRTLANRGIKDAGSYSNCYSIGYVPDSLDGIMDVASKIALTFKAQGGQGLSLSKIRPKGSLIRNKYQSDGIVPFMHIFNTVTESISQGGSRKGALLMSIDALHPEALTFIKIKENPNEITKANLSVECSDDFMRNAEEGGNYLDIYNAICESAWKSAEPGIIFTNRFRNYNIMEFIDEYQIETCNPCGEQPLAKNSACNLSSINVSAYVDDPFTSNARINTSELNNDIKSIVKAMDDVLEENTERHALQEQREMSQKFRNIGIGIMGLADMLVKLGIKYGSKEAVNITEDLMKTIFKRSVIESSLLAIHRGNFPGYSPKVWNSTIIKNTFDSSGLYNLKELDKLRNCSLISIAPTGSN